MLIQFFTIFLSIHPMQKPQTSQSSSGITNKFSKSQFNQQLNVLHYSSFFSSNSSSVESSSDFTKFSKEIEANFCIKRLFSLTMEAIEQVSYKNAIFFADKLCSALQSPFSTFLLAKCFYLNEDFKKVHSLFAKSKVINLSVDFQILAAKALLKNSQYEQCLVVLEMALEQPHVTLKQESTRFFLKAQCHEANENKLFAVTCYFDCLKKDPTFVEAFNKLIDCHLITNSEKKQLLAEMNFGKEDLWIKAYYMERIRDIVPFEKEEEGKSGNFVQDLNDTNGFDFFASKDNIDILCIQAKRAFMKYDISKAYDLSLKIIKEDPLYFDIIPIYCICLQELNILGELYYCAHNLSLVHKNNFSRELLGTLTCLVRRWMLLHANQEIRCRQKVFSKGESPRQILLPVMDRLRSFLRHSR